MRLLIHKNGPAQYTVDAVDLPGSPAIGVGTSMDAALGDFLRNHADHFGVVIGVDETCLAAEQARQANELKKR